MRILKAGRSLSIHTFVVIILFASCSRGKEIYYTKLGDDAFDREQYLSAKNYFNQALDIDSINADALYKLGYIALTEGRNQNNLGKALMYYTKAEAINPKTKRLMVNIAAVKLYLHDTIGAMEYFAKAMQADSSDYENYYYRSLVNFMRGDIKRGAADLNKAVACAADSLGVRLDRGLWELQQNDLSKAWDDFQNVIKNSKYADKAYWGQAELALRVHDTANAITHIDYAVAEVALRNNPHRSDSLFYLGRRDDLIKDTTFAVREYNWSLDANPYNGKVYSARGCDEIMLGQYRDAINDYDSAIKYGSILSGTYHYYRGIAYQKMGDTINAAKDFKIARSRGYVESEKDKEKKPQPQVNQDK